MCPRACIQPSTRLPRMTHNGSQAQTIPCPFVCTPFPCVRQGHRFPMGRNRRQELQISALMRIPPRMLGSSDDMGSRMVVLTDAGSPQHREARIMAFHFNKSRPHAPHRHPLESHVLSSGAMRATQKGERGRLRLWRGNSVRWQRPTCVCVARAPPCRRSKGRSRARRASRSSSTRACRLPPRRWRE